MRSIPAEIVQEIKQRVDIVSIVGNHVQLKRDGAAFKGLCPFHSEKTPSFKVHPARRMFHCFGCGAGGDVIAFLRRIENKSFIEVLEQLAGMAGVDLTPYRQENSDGIAIGRIYAALEAAQSHFRAQLEKSRECRRYLKERGITEQASLDFGLGFAPDSWDMLCSYLRKLKFTEEELVSSGLARKRKQSDGVYDYFRNRLTIPIVNEYGRIVGFGGRLIGEGEPKYMNSPETQVYSKGRLLFNLDKAAPGRDRVEHLVLVEGYLDVIAMHQAGYPRAIASLGTALTDRQVKIILKKTNRLYLGYDSDKAGIRATMRAIEALNRTDIEVRLLSLPLGLDPDDLIKTQGPAGMQRAIDSAVRIERYLSDAVCRDADISTPDGRERVLRRLLPLYSQLPSIVARENLIKLISDRLELPEAEVRKSLSRHSGLAGRDETERVFLRARPRQSGQSLTVKAERQLVRCFLLEIASYHKYKERIKIEDFHDPLCRRALQRLQALEDFEEGPVYDDLIDPNAEENDPWNRFITKEVVSSNVTPDSACRVVEEALETIRKIHLDQRKEELQRLIRQCTDFTQKMNYVKELNELLCTIE